MMEELDPKTIKRDLHTREIGQETICHRSVGSTNDVAKELAKEGAAEGTVIVAEEQTRGKGRWGRKWLAPRSSSLLVSIILRPALSFFRLPWLTMASSLAVARAVEDITGLSVQFKWPNDILLESKKAGGILVEVGISGDILDYAVVGLGLNVNLDVRQIPEIADTATSISMQLGPRVSRLALLRSFLESMEKEYRLVQQGESPRERWASRLSLPGHKVQVTTPSGQESGWVEGVDADGSLILRRDDGTRVHIVNGDLIQ